MAVPKLITTESGDVSDHHLQSLSPLISQDSQFSRGRLVGTKSGQCSDPRNLRFLWTRIMSSLDLQLRVLGSLPYEDLFRFKCVSKPVKTFLESDPFRGLYEELSSSKSRARLTPSFFSIASDGTWQWSGFDSLLNKWRQIPPLTYLPNPEIERFKEYLVCAAGGLVCFNVSKSVDKEELIVCNPLSGACRVIPPLHHRRNPVLMHMIVDSRTHAFKLIVAGNSSSSTQLHNLSSITEVFDSSDSKWTVTGSVPGPDYAFNEFQTGVYLDGHVLCIAFLDAEQKGILAYNVEQGRWTSLLPLSMSSTRSNSGILQLVECNGHAYLFSEQEIISTRHINGYDEVEHCVDKLEWRGDLNGPGAVLTNVIRTKKPGGGGRSLEIYPEYVCVAYGENSSQLCIFNTVSHTGVIYELGDHSGQPAAMCQALQAPPEAVSGDQCFYSLNPLSFPVELSLTSQVI